MGGHLGTWVDIDPIGSYLPTRGRRRFVIGEKITTPKVDPNEFLVCDRKTVADRTVARFNPISIGTRSGSPFTSPGADIMSVHTHPVLNRDREEIRVPSPQGQELLAFLFSKGLRGWLRTDRAGDLICLEGEPDMGRVSAILRDWERAPLCAQAAL